MIPKLQLVVVEETSVQRLDDRYSRHIGRFGDRDSDVVDCSIIEDSLDDGHLI